MASIYLPPIARKKKVDGWPRQNTYQVFGDFQENNSKMATSYNSQFVRHNVPPSEQRVLSAGRKNRPQPTSATFLRQNPRFNCEPICHVNTVLKDTTELHGHRWWPIELPENKAKIPKYSLDSTSRFDYQTIGKQKDSSQCTGNHHINESATGIAGKSRYVEKVSYEHQYNSRLDPNEPIRGKRHGSFVWKPLVSIPVRNGIHTRLPPQQESQDQAQTSTSDNQEVSGVSKPSSEQVQKDSGLEKLENEYSEELFPKSHGERNLSNQMSGVINSEQQTVKCV